MWQYYSTSMLVSGLYSINLSKLHPTSKFQAILNAFCDLHNIFHQNAFASWCKQKGISVQKQKSWGQQLKTLSFSLKCFLQYLCCLCWKDSARDMIIRKEGINKGFTECFLAQRQCPSPACATWQAYISWSWDWDRLWWCALSELWDGWSWWSP